jgi:hypothetical protein
MVLTKWSNIEARYCEILVEISRIETLENISFVLHFRKLVKPPLGRLRLNFGAKKFSTRSPVRQRGTTIEIVTDYRNLWLWKKLLRHLWICMPLC